MKTLRVRILTNQEVYTTVKQILYVVWYQVETNDAYLACISHALQRAGHTGLTAGGHVNCLEIWMPAQRLLGQLLCGDFIILTVYGGQCAQIRKALFDFVAKAMKAQGVRMVVVIAGDGENQAAVVGDGVDQSGAGAAGKLAVLTDKAHALGVVNVGVERHDRNARVYQRVDFLFHARVVRRTDCQAADVLCEQFVNQLQLYIHIQTDTLSNENFTAHGGYFACGVINAGAQQVHKRCFGCLCDDAQLHRTVRHCQRFSGAIRLIPKIVCDFANALRDFWFDAAAVI